MTITPEQQQALDAIGPMIVAALRDKLPDWCFVLLLAPAGSKKAICLANAPPQDALHMMACAAEGLEQVGAEIEAANAREQGAIN